MLKFVCTSVKSSFRPCSTVLELILIRISPFSSVSSVAVENQSKTISNGVVDEKPYSFAVEYLIKRCGFPEKRAFSAGKSMKFETPDRPDSIIAVLKKHGLTDEQVSSAVKAYPRILLCRPEKSISPKIEFLQSLGFQDAEISRMCSGNLLRQSLNRQMIPSWGVLRNVFSSRADLAFAIERFPDILTRTFQRSMMANIEILRNMGAPEPNILHLLKSQPRVFWTPADTMKELAETLEKMGLNPRDKGFIRCLWRMSAINSSIWKQKVAVYERWGLNEDQVLEAFKKHPCVMAVSEGKIINVMNFLVHEMGYDSSDVLNVPCTLSISFKKKIIPRCSVGQVLLAKGLISKNPRLSSLLLHTEGSFLKRYVERFEKEAPELFKVYREKKNFQND